MIKRINNPKIHRALELERFQQPVNFKKPSHFDLIVLVIAIFLAVNAKQIIDSWDFNIQAQGIASSPSTSQVAKPAEANVISNEVLIKIGRNILSKNLYNHEEKTGNSVLDFLAPRVGIVKIEKVINAGDFAWYKLTVTGKREVIKAPQSTSTQTSVDMLGNNPDPGQRLKSTLETLRHDSSIKKAEPNFVVQADQVTGIPNDPYYSSKGSWGQAYDDLWGLKKINVQAAWSQITGSSSIVVAVVDSGVDRNHEDIAANMWVNSKEIPNNGVDDDGNGYVDDYYGWNYVANNNDPMDDYGHGTHVAGTIGAVGNNGVGVVGVNPGAKIMSLKFISGLGSGSNSDAAKAIIYAANNGAKVINMSFGCYCGTPFVLQDAISYAQSKNVILVAAAGNSNVDAATHYPASDPNVIAVGAIGIDDKRTGYSNYGSKIDVVAPGDDILSLKASNAPHCTLDKTVANKYCRLSGTSMAAPHVSGIASLLAVKNPNLGTEDVRQILRITADDALVAGYDIYTGKGRVNANNAMSYKGGTMVAKITSPYSSSGVPTINGNLDFIGTANGSGFLSYDLSYRQLVSTGGWTSFSSSNLPVVNGRLGFLNLASFLSQADSGDYLFRLLVKNNVGESFDSYVLLTNSTTKNVRQLTLMEPGLLNVSISGNYIVYSDNRNGPNGSIFLFDLVKNTERNITNDQFLVDQPRISGDKIVWTDYRQGYSTPQIYLYDITNNTQRRITSGSNAYTNPRIWGNKVVYETILGGVFLYDLDLNKETTIANPTSGAIDDLPDTNGRIVAWLHKAQADKYISINLLDLSSNTTTQILTDAASTGSLYPPRIGENYLVWNSSASLHVYDLQKRAERIVQTLTKPQYVSQSGFRVVWNSVGSGLEIDPTGIYLDDLSSDNIRVITKSGVNPDVSNNKVVWLQYSTNAEVVYLYEDPAGSPQPSPSPVLAPTPTPTPPALGALPCYFTNSQGQQQAYGDIDGNNAINVNDYTLVTKYIYQNEPLTVDQKKAADVTKDGTINYPGDVITIAKFVNKQITTFPVCS